MNKKIILEKNGDSINVFETINIKKQNVSKLKKQLQTETNKDSVKKINEEILSVEDEIKALKQKVSKFVKKNIGISTKSEN